MANLDQRTYFKPHRQRGKAGLLPYVFDDGEPIFIFMIPSNPKMGGLDPAIAKGNIEAGETPLQAAIREASEELGLRASNMLKDTLDLIWTGSGGFSLSIYTCQIINTHDFDEPHFETRETVWMNYEDFSRVGKMWQIPIVKKARDSILNPYKDLS